MPVLENVSGRLRTYTLTGAHLATHATHENRYRHARRVTVHQSKAGGLAMRVTSLLLPDSIRLVTGERRDVSPEVAHCPEIKAAVARGELRVAESPEPAPSPPADPPAEEAAPVAHEAPAPQEDPHAHRHSISPSGRDQEGDMS